MARKINYKKKLWTLFSRHIRLKYADDNGQVRCVTCGSIWHWKEIHAGHYIPKSRGLSVYFEERNVHPQCVACNTYHHGALDKYALFLQEKYGPGILEELDQLSRQIKKISKFEYEEMIEHYKGMVSET